jgi:hypothetical protein
MSAADNHYTPGRNQPAIDACVECAIGNSECCPDHNGSHYHPVDDCPECGGPCRLSPIGPPHDPMHDARDCPECDYRMAVSTSLDTGHSPSCPARKGNPCEDAVCGANAIRMLLEDIIAGRTTLAAAMEPTDD